MHNYDAQQHRVGQIISPLTLQTITIALMLSVGGEGSVETIIHDHLKLTKVSARWVSRKLTDHDHARRVTTSQEIVNVFESDPVKFVQQIVTGDEIWVHH